ncbi:MAG: DUF5668 domain-containing protein [Bacteroidetes bacterium]|nr:DUF5668 domain-containing protein [Bacteroidota bacterium]
MEDEEIKNEQDLMKEWEKTHKRGRIIGGLLVITAGSLFLARETGTLIPEWVFSWKMLLIAMGVYVAIKHSFRKFFWLPLVLVGGVFLITQDLSPELSISKYLWPAAIILFGLMIIFKPRKNCPPQHHWKQHNWKWHKENHKKQHFQCSEENDSPEDHIQNEIIFSGVKKNIISKDFKGGSVRIIFGGAEINLSKSDIIGKAEIKIDQVFGGLKLIVPANWKVKSEMSTIMASIEDKRNIHNDLTTESDKVLVLKGNVVFGGIEIKSY